MRERFEDDCLLSTPSRADNQELEEEKGEKKMYSKTAVISSLMQKAWVPEPKS